MFNAKYMPTKSIKSAIKTKKDISTVPRVRNAAVNMIARAETVARIPMTVSTIPVMAPCLAYCWLGNKSSFQGN